jgi:hypothetical protein
MSGHSGLLEPLDRALLEVAGREVRHLAGGAGSVVVVLHEQTPAAVQRCWGRMSSGHKVIAIAQSELGDLTMDELADALGEEPFSVIGTGNATPSAVSLASQAEVQCERLILVSPQSFDGLEGVRAPSLILFGTEDELADVSRAGSRPRIANSSLAFVYDAGPDITADRPEALEAVCRDFVERGLAFARRVESTRINP